MITIDWQNKIVESAASILDLPVFHAALRDLEDSPEGVIHPVTHTWKALDLGGAYFYQADLANGYTLKFIGAGPFQISGNLNGSIVDTGVQVERKTSAAYSTSSVGSSGPSAESIAAAVVAALGGSAPVTSDAPTVDEITVGVLSALNATTIPVDMKKTNGITIIGTGSKLSPWRPA